MNVRLNNFNLSHLPHVLMQGFSGVVLALLLTAVIMLSLQSRAAVVNRQDIEAAVQAHILEVADAKGFTKNAGEISVELLKLPDVSLNFPAVETVDDITFSVESSLDRFFGARTLVRVFMTTETGRQRQIGVPVKISLNKPVWVVKTMVMPGQKLSKKDLVLENRVITKQFEKILDQSFPIDAYAARLMLRPDQIVLLNQINRPPVVRRNHPVNMLLIGHNGTKIRMEGRCLQDGHVGSRVRVRHATIRDKYFSAIVTGQNQVKVNI